MILRWSDAEARRHSSWQSSWAVRRDWPDGAHEFIGVRRTRRAAQRIGRGDQAFWRRSPLIPNLSVVEISKRDFELHARFRRDCKAPDCPAPKLPVNRPYRTRSSWWTRLLD